MSKAIKLSKRDLEYLRFGGASQYRTKLEETRIQHTSIAEGLLEIVPFSVQPGQLFIGHGSSALTAEQASTLGILTSAAKDSGYRVQTVSRTAGKNSTTSILLTHDKPVTLDEFFGRSTESGTDLVYTKRKTNS
jgi:hypothetical protein